MSQRSREKWRIFAQWAALILSVVWIYGPAMTGDFIWDDRTYMIQNSLIRADDGLSQIWSTAKMSDFWPLSYSLYWLMFRLFGENPLGYHLVAISLHLTSVVLLWRLLDTLKVRCAYIAAFLFAIHPVCVESVAWIIESKTTLASSFALGSALFFSQSRNSRDWRYGLSLGLFLAAMLAKAAVAPWPFVLLLIRVWQHRNLRLTKTDWLGILPFFGVAFLFIGLNVYWYAEKTSFEVASEAIRDDGFFSRLAIAGKAFWFYIGKAILPLGLAFIYPRWTIYDPPQIVHFLPLATLLAFAGFLLYMAWKRPQHWGAALLFLYMAATLAPALGLYDVYQMRYTLVTDHWFYYGLMGATTAMAAGFEWIIARWKTVGQTATLVAVIFFGYAAHNHAKIFTDEETIWRATLKANPDSWMVHKTLGLVLKLKGRLAEAEAAYREAIRLKPQAETLYNLAIILEARDDYREAISLYLEALKLNPYHWAIYNNLGSIQVRLGLVNEAKESFEKGLSFHPSFVTHFNLGLILEEQGEKASAEHHFQEAQKLARSAKEKLAAREKLNKINSQ